MAGGSTQRCRALFGIMKAQWQFLARPITLMGLEDIGRRVYCCLILHNMNVTDRVMGDVKMLLLLCLPSSLCPLYIISTTVWSASLPPSSVSSVVGVCRRGHGQKRSERVLMLLMLLM